MRTRKPHWPTRSTLKADATVQEHLISERALRDHLRELRVSSSERDQVLAQLDEAIRESRIT